MRFGLVKFLNARPLDRGLVLQSRSSESTKIIMDTPANLARRLLRGELDTALISSVECLRNRETLDYNNDVGVCARTHVDSILFLQNLSTEKGSLDRLEKLYVDRGSRSSVALLQVLLREAGLSQNLPTIETDPEAIPSMVDGDDTSGGLIIGDTALSFLHSDRVDSCHVTDLSAWWNRLTGFPFVFALWAYPRQSPLEPEVFLESLSQGERDLEIMATESEYETPVALEYIKETLHYRMGEAERQAIALFDQKLKEFNLL